MLFRPIRLIFESNHVNVTQLLQENICDHEMFQRSGLVELLLSAANQFIKAQMFEYTTEVCDICKWGRPFLTRHSLDLQAFDPNI